MVTAGEEFVNSSDPRRLRSNYSRLRRLFDEGAPRISLNAQRKLKEEQKRKIDSIRDSLFEELHKSLHLSYEDIKTRWGSDVDKIAQARADPKYQTPLNIDSTPYPGSAGSTQTVHPPSIISEHLRGGTNPTGLQEEEMADSLQRNRVHPQNSLIAGSSGDARSHLCTTNHLVTVPDTTFNSQKNPNGEEVKIDILDGDHDQRRKNTIMESYASSRATNYGYGSSSRGNELNCDGWTHTPQMAQNNFNRPKTSNAEDVRIDILDGNHDQRGKKAMLDDCAHASSSHSYELNRDVWTHTPMMAKDHFNQQKTSNGADTTNDDRASPVTYVGWRENKTQTDFNNNILGITGQAAISLVSSTSGSPFLHLCAAATGVGFLGSFLANYAMKRPKLARILSKIAAIGVAFAVIIALGMHFPKDTKWHLDVVATAIACLIAAVVVATSKSDKLAN